MPKRRTVLSRRSAAEWAVRGGLAIAAVGLGCISGAHSLAYMMRGTAPERAHALSPGDGRVTALLSEKLSGPDASAADRRDADELARLALRQDPTAVSAVATLGIDAQVRGDTAGARRILAYSERLSRRDLRTRLWAIEDAVGRGNIAEALRSYDIALRTSRVAPDLLFPVLASAIGDAEIRGALVATLAKHPVWKDQFISYAASRSPDTLASVRLLYDLHRHRIDVSSAEAAELVRRLVAEGRNEDAWRYYAMVAGKVDRRMSRDPVFATAHGSPTIFDWQPMIDSGISASIQPGDNGNVFDFAVPSNLGGPLLRQAQLLPPGEYIIEGRSSGIAQTPDALPYWTLTCADGRELGRVIIPSSTQAQGRFSGRLTVPSLCPMQQLQMVARPSDLMSGVTGQILEVRLRPVEG